jgi:hypothetical protein
MSFQSCTAQLHAKCSVSEGPAKYTVAVTDRQTHMSSGSCTTVYVQAKLFICALFNNAVSVVALGDWATERYVSH